MKLGHAAGESSQRDLARQRLREHTTPDAVAHDAAPDTVGDLALIHAVARRNLAAPADGSGMADALAALTLLRHLREELAGWEPRLIAAARASGASWIQLAPAIGVASRQAAERRYLRLRHDGTDPASTGEQRVQAERERRAGDRAVVTWARQNAVGLRQLAAQVSALDGDQHLAGDAQDRVNDVTVALGGADTSALLAPLVEAGPHLRTRHPLLADRITAITDQSDYARTNRTTAPRPE